MISTSAARMNATCMAQRSAMIPSRSNVSSSRTAFFTGSSIEVQSKASVRGAVLSARKAVKVEARKTTAQGKQVQV